MLNQEKSDKSEWAGHETCPKQGPEAWVWGINTAWAAPPGREGTKGGEPFLRGACSTKVYHRVWEGKGVGLALNFYACDWVFHLWSIN